MVIKNRNGPDMKNPEKLFAALSKRVPCGKYYEFATYLGLKYNSTCEVLKRHRDNFTDATRENLGTWEDMGAAATKSGLKKALVDAEIGSLCEIVDTYFDQVASNTREAETRDQLGASPSSSTSQIPAVVQKNMTINISGSAPGSTIAGGIVNIGNRANTDEDHAPVPTKLSKPESALGEKGQDRKTSEDEESSDEEESDGLQPGIFEQKVKRADPREGIELNSSTSYEMDTSTTKRGMALIINNFEKKVHTKKKKNRRGSRLDRERVTRVFEQLGLECISCTDLTVKEMENKLKEFQEKVEGGRNIRVAVIFIMSHGDETSVRGVDRRRLQRSKIRQCLMDMKSMIRKPKVIFYQACQGRDKPEMVEADDLTMDSSCEMESDDLDKRYLTNNVDMYEASASSFGHLSFRNKNGSWFVSYLCQELILNAHNTDLDTMMERVTGKIAEKRSTTTDENTDEEKLACQTPSVTKTFTKKLYFLPGYTK